MASPAGLPPSNLTQGTSDVQGGIPAAAPQEVEKADGIAQNILGAKVQLQEVPMDVAEADKLIDRYKFSFKNATSSLEIKNPKGEKEELPLLTMKSLAQKIPDLFEKVLEVHLKKIAGDPKLSKKEQAAKTQKLLSTFENMSQWKIKKESGLYILKIIDETTYNALPDKNNWDKSKANNPPYLEFSLEATVGDEHHPTTFLSLKKPMSEIVGELDRGFALRHEWNPDLLISAQKKQEEEAKKKKEQESQEAQRMQHFQQMMQNMPPS